MRSTHRAASALAIAAAIALAGCKKEIYHGLTEDEANEVLVVLKAANPNINAEKIAAGSGKQGMLFTIAVDEQYAVEAMRIMLDHQLPRKELPGLAQTFAQKSMIPTETEEKAQLLFAMQSELANSLEQIDGVVDARVHLVLPEMSPLEGRDVTPARASVLIKYREKERAAEGDPRKEAAEYKMLLAELNDDLKKLKQLWTVELPALLTDDQRQLLALDQYLNQVRRDDPQGAPAREALQRLNQSATKRLGLQAVLASLPKIKDLEGVINKTEKVQIESVGFASATIRSLVANATPRLLEDNVSVNFTKVVPRPVAKLPTIVRDWKADYFVPAAGAAAVLALGLVGMGVWLMSLRGRLAAAEAKLRGAAGAPGAPGGGAPQG